MLRVISLGAGVQSSCLALMAAAGEIEPPDCAIFADTGWEPTAVYQHLDRLEAALPFPVYRVSAGNLRDDVVAAAGGLRIGKARPQPPYHIQNPDGSKGFVSRQCTRDYKVVPIQREMRRLTGLTGKRSPKHAVAEQWLGISTDEAHRMRHSDRAWIRHRYPLIDRRMSRADCFAWLARHGWAAPKSSCIGCPFHSDEQWRALTAAEMAEAIAVDRAVRAGHRNLALIGLPYLHASLQPLDQVDFSTWAQRGQADLFGADCSGMCGV